jgi:ribosomal protein S18 acetylase RimI-like enzyme
MGIGRALLHHALQVRHGRGYKQAMLWVLESNARAREFYEAAGWTPDGAVKIDEWPGTILHEVHVRRQKKLFMSLDGNYAIRACCLAVAILQWDV